MIKSRSNSYWWGICIGLFTIAILFTIPMIAGHFLDVKWNRYVLTSMVGISYALGLMAYFQMKDKEKTAQEIK